MIRTTPESIRNSGTADPCSSPDLARLPIQFFLIVPVVHDSSAAVVHLVADLDTRSIHGFVAHLGQGPGIHRASWDELAGRFWDGEAAELQARRRVVRLQLGRSTTLRIIALSTCDGVQGLLYRCREQCITRAICRKPAPSSAILRHCSIWSGVKAGGRPTFFPLPRTRSNPSLIRSLAESTW